MPALEDDELVELEESGVEPAEEPALEDPDPVEGELEPEAAVTVAEDVAWNSSRAVR